MKRTTKKLSGVGLELYLRQHYAGYDDIGEALAGRMAKDGVSAFASVRVRRLAWRDRQSGRKIAVGTAAADVAAPAADKTTEPPTKTASTQSAPFDPYSIGLIPIFQREGADGLLAKLNDVGSLDNLRKMARSQQVALPAELRGADADIDAVRAAIVEAAGKRIANRRAAAS